MQTTGKTDFITAENVVFHKIIDGLEMGSIIGNFQETAHGTFVKLATGVRVPLHHYDAPVGGVVIKGKVAHPVPGNEISNAILEPGAYFSFSEGEPHETNNMGDEEALFFIFQEGPWKITMD